MKNAALLITYLWAFSSLSIAQPAHNKLNAVWENASNNANNTTKLSLNDAINSALDKSENIKIARQKITLAQLDQHKGNAGYLPTVSAQLVQNNQYSQPNLQTYFVNNTYFQSIIAPSVQAQWTVFNGFQQKTTENQLRTQTELAQNELKIIEQDKTYEVKKNYYIALAEQEKLQLNRQIHAISVEQYLLFQQREERGQSSRYELLLSEQNTLSDEMTVRLQLINYQQAMANLLMSMGSNANAQSYTLSEKFTNQLKNYALEPLKNQMAQGTIAKQGNLLTQQQSYNIELAKAKQFPTVNLNGGSSWLYNKTKFLEADAIKGSNFDIYLGASVSMTLYNGGQIKRNIQKAILQKEINKDQLQAINREINYQLKNKIDEYNDLQTLANLNEKHIKVIQEGLNIAEQRLKGGVSDLNEFRIAQSNYLHAQYNHIDIVLKCKLAENDIERLVK
jgi:outer membrane protein